MYITEQKLTEQQDPYTIQPKNPLEPIPEPTPGDLNQPSTPGNQTLPDAEPTLIPSYVVRANRTSCPEGEFIIYTITTENVENGTIVYYTLLGNNITTNDIVGGSLTGEFVVNNNEAKVTVGIAEDGVVEDEETLTFTLNGKGASVDVLIITRDDLEIGDYDEGVGDTPENQFSPFEPPSVDPSKIITDDNGGIIEILLINQEIHGQNHHMSSLVVKVLVQ